MYVRCNNPKCLFHPPLHGDHFDETPFETMVLALLQYSYRRFFKKANQTCYLLVIPRTDYAFWYASDYFDVIDPAIPDWWTCVNHDKNVFIPPKDRLSGDVGVPYFYYNGPIEVMNNPQLLVDLINKNDEASDVIRNIYLVREKIDIYPEE